MVEPTKQRWEDAVKAGFAVLRLLLDENSDLTNSEKRQIEIEAQSIAEKFWFFQGRTSGERFLLGHLKQTARLKEKEVQEWLAVISLGDGAVYREILADIVGVIGKLRPHVRPKRDRGRPSRQQTISGRDLLVLADAISRGSPLGKSLKAAVTAYYNAGELPHTTTIDGHIKRIKRRIDAIAAVHNSGQII